MTDPTLLITVSRLLVAGSPDPLVFSGSDDDNNLGIMGFQRPSLVGRVTYTQDSKHAHGSAPIAAAWQQAILGWDWCPDQATSETEVQSAYAEVAAALGQFTYTVTTEVAGAPAEVWKADMGSIVPSARSYEDLASSNPVFAITIPVYPIAGS